MKKDRATWSRRGVRRRLLPAIVSIAMVGIAACGASSSESESAADFYKKNNRVDVIIPYGPGGGTDLRMRYMADWYKKFLPGNPNVIPKNVEGGGGIIGMNQWFNGKSDGSQVAISSVGGLNLPVIYGNEELNVDLDKAVPTAAMTASTAFYVAPSTGIESAADLRNPDEELVLPDLAPDAGGLAFLIAFELLDMDVKVVFGYEGSGPKRIAFEQGEANVNWDTESAWKSDVQPLIDDGKAKPIFTEGRIDADGNIVRDPSFPDIKTVPEIYEELNGEPMSGIELEVWKYLIVSLDLFSNVMWIHEDAGDDVIQAWKDAAVSMNESDEFWSEGGREIVGSTDLLTGDELDRAYDGFMNVDPEARKWILDFLAEEYDVDYR